MQNKLYLAALSALLALAACTNTPKPQQSPAPTGATVTIDGKVYSISGNFTLSDGLFVDPSDTVIIVPPDPTDTITIPPSGIGDAEKSGTKAFPYSGLQRIYDLGFRKVSTYVPIHWISTKNGMFLEPFAQAWTNEAPGLDSYLAKAKSMGIKVHLVACQTPEYFIPTGNGTGGNELIPVPAGKSTTDPASYEWLANIYFNLAARYGNGNVSINDPRLTIDQKQQWANQPINQKKVNLNMNFSLAFGNERDNWFEGWDSPKYTDPAEHAALLVACVKAVRSADPNLEYYIAGLTDFNLPYLKAVYTQYVKLWPEGAAYFPNVDCHHYSNILNRPGTDKPTWAESGGCYPEDDAAFPQIRDIVRWVQSLPTVPGKRRKCIVSEFGYDKKRPSMMHIKGNGISDAEAQAIGITKTFRALIAAGVDEAYVFEDADERHGENGGQFATCGLFGRQVDGYPPHPSATAVKTMLAQMRKEVSVGKNTTYPMSTTEQSQIASPGTLKTGEVLKIGDMRKRAKQYPLPQGQ